MSLNSDGQITKEVLIAYALVKYAFFFSVYNYFCILPFQPRSFFDICLISFLHNDSVLIIVLYFQSFSFFIIFKTFIGSHRER